ncbi:MULTISPECIES: ferritin-like domain-containing protein [unclassified Streptomyces]|uniref:ferritin-like domain-containing protein n=1 Tax=unclassified Streptomyces TaxID=2593676 RepID=UPI00278BB32C|nr:MULTISPECIES: ferritin-like domain-containing protein [unclassified Streptomyces]
MSVFDLPRLHFAGHAVTRLPTGPRGGLYDLARHRALTGDGRPFPVDRPAEEYHRHLDGLGDRFEPDGRSAPDGRFGTVKGWNFGGNGHFWLDARITGWERAAGDVDTGDPVVGRHVDVWGHYNDHLATTHNRARVFDVDPASDWTTTVLAGQFGFGRRDRSHETGYLAMGAVTGPQPPRWHNSRYVLDVGEHPLADRFRRSVVHQFAVDADDGLEWFAGTETSEAAGLLRARVTGDDFAGLVVRYALTNMATPRANDAPDVWQVRGTIAPWRREEERTWPAGRLLSARGPRRSGAATPLHNAAVHVTPGHTTFDLVTAVPVTHRAPAAGPGPVHRLGPRLDVGDLELRTRDSGRLVARVPAAAYLADTDPTGGLVTVPTDPVLAAQLAEDAGPDEPLVLIAATPGEPAGVLLTEEEVVIRTDDCALFLEPTDAPDFLDPRHASVLREPPHAPNRLGPRHTPADGDHGTCVRLRAYRLGRPAPATELRVAQFFNPRALPADPRAGGGAKSGDVRTVDLRPGAPPHEGADDGGWAAACAVTTDADGRASFAVRCASPGAARLLVLPAGDDLPCDPAEPGSAARAYDGDDRLGYWPAVCAVDVRVLPDTRHLDSVPRAEVTFDLLHREVFAPYELLYSFMKDEIFSLADASRVATYARLIWLMCDPANKDKTYYMPSSRDMTAPQVRLLLAYLRQDEAGRRPPPRTVPRRARPGALTTRAQLHEALREAATVELAVMQQYLYAAWSIPLYGAGRELVRRGEWSPRQLRLACGDGGETLSNGMRGSLLNVAREEMTHFLVINNIITAMGLPFHLPRIDFGTVNHRLRVPLDLSLEGFGLGSVQRFIALEQPHGLGPDLADDGTAPVRNDGRQPYAYQSLSDLYAAIREGIATVPDLFPVRRGRGGGEHHLFMRESVNWAHPDYQLEVDDVASALFAVDFVTEHGEGDVLRGAEHDEDSHYETFLRISDLLIAEHHGHGPHREAGPRRPPWTPAYPVPRNPTRHAGDPARELVTDPRARAAMAVFDEACLLMNQLMVQHFGAAADASLRRSRLMNGAIDVMTGIMRPLAEHLVTLPAGRPGRTAGPAFELPEDAVVIPRQDVAARVLGRRFAELADRAAGLSGLPARVADLARSFAEDFEKAGAQAP